MCTHSEFPPSCLCYHGYAGAHCEMDINECESDPCERGRCIDGIDSYSCDVDLSCAKDTAFLACKYLHGNKAILCNNLEVTTKWNDNSSTMSDDAECFMIGLSDCNDPYSRLLVMSNLMSYTCETIDKQMNCSRLNQTSEGTEDLFQVCVVEEISAVSVLVRW